MIPLTVQHKLSADEVAEVKELAHAAKAVDGVKPLSDAVLLSLHDAGAVHVLARDGALLGYAHLAEGAAELVVHPAHRRQGLGRVLTEQLLALSPSLRLWARAENPGASALAASLGFTRTRVLLQLRRALSDPLDPVVVPDGVTIRTFVPGDEEAVATVNARAFATHPEQGRWTVDDIVAREAEPWFSAVGFFLAHKGSELLGFHWTKVVDGLGEVYVVGVDPSAQGTGLGRALTLIGLHHLQSLGLETVLLYVDESNAAAVHVYTRLGFTVHSADVTFSRG